MSTGAVKWRAAPHEKTNQLVLLCILILSFFTRLGDCNVSGSGSTLINPVSGLTLSVDEVSNTLTVIWTDNSMMMLLSYFVNYTATVGSTEIAGESESVASTSHNITGDFVQSGVSITVSVEAVVGDQLCDPAFSSLLVDGDFSPTPETFTVSDPTSASLTLSWSVPFPQVTPNSFSLSYTINKLTGSPPPTTSSALSVAIGSADLHTTDNASFSYVLEPLTAYTEYSFNLFSVYGNATSSAVSASETTSEAMSGPVEVLTANITHDTISDSFTISISWSEPTEPNGVIQQYNYTVFNTDTNTAVVTNFTVSGSTSVVESMLSSIEPYTNYTVTVVAINSVGKGDSSTLIVESPQTAPGPVGNLQAFFNETGSVFDSMTRLHSLNIDIVWNEPLMPNGVITTYSVIVYRTDNSSDVIYSNSTLTAPNVTESVIVLPFANYTVNVAASTSAGEGDESTVTITSPQAEPGQVGNLNAFFVEMMANFNSTLHIWTIDIYITWEVPVYPNGIITTYSVTVYQTDNSSDILFGDSTLTSPNVTASVMVPAYTNYTVSVAASTSAGEGDESTVTITSPQAEPGRVSNLDASFDVMPEFNADTRMQTVNIAITWTQPVYPNGVIESYSVSVYETANPDNVVYNASAVTSTTVTTSVIVLPFTNYTVSVAASTSAGEGEGETFTLTSPQAVPGQVENLNALFIRTGAVFDSENRMYDLNLEIEWSDPTYPNGIIESYAVTVNRTDDSSDVVYSDGNILVNSVTESVTVLPFTNYTVSVAASTSAGQGDENFITIESPEAVPGPVVGLDSTFSTTGRSYNKSIRTYTVDLSITWSEPEYPNGVITLYTVTVTQADDSTVEVYSDDSIETPNVTVSVMVVAFTDYTVTVAANTSAGQGDSTTDTVTSPEAAPGMVENLDADFVTDGSVFNSEDNLWTIDIGITWEVPVYPNGIITTYSVTVSQTDNSSDIIFSSSTLTAPNVTESVMVPAYTNYTVSVAASTSAGEGNESTITITSPQAAPSQVVDLTAVFGESIDFDPDSRMHNVTLNISWSRPLYPNGLILSYEVIVTQTSDSSVVIYEENVNNVEIMPEVMILPFTNYTVSVAASTSAGQGDESTVTITSPQAAPSQVVDLTAVFGESIGFDPDSRMHNVTLNISWSRPLYPNGLILSYEVIVTQTSDSSVVIYEENVNNVEIMPEVMILPFTNYTVSVAASTSAGQGDESTVTITSPQAAPSQVVDLTAVFGESIGFDPDSRMHNVTLNISWSRPLYPNGLILSYEVIVTQTSDSSVVIYEENVNNVEIMPEVMILPFTNYTVSVAASTSAGQGDESTVTITSPQAAPSQVVDLTAVFGESLGFDPDSRMHNVTLNISWSRPLYPNGLILSYEVIVTQTSDSSVVIYKENVNNVEIMLEVMVLPFTNYIVSVAASTSAGEGDESTVTITSPEAAPGRVGNLDASFSAMSDYNRTTQMLTVNITITWTQPVYPNGVIQSYSVSVYEAGDLSAIVFSDNTLTATTVTTSVMALPFTSYTVSVAASTSAGEGDEEIFTLTAPQAAPTAPRNVVVMALTSTSIRVSWALPQPANGAITGYIVTYTVTGISDSLVNKSVPSGQLSLDIPGLTPFTSYTVYVEAVTVATGDKSDDITVVTLEDAPTAPMNVRTSGINATSITVEWEEPTTPNGDIRGYNISHNLSDSVTSVGGSERAVTFSGLSPFTRYLFTVFAFTVEAGPEASVSARTNEAAPSAPLQVMAANTSSTSILVSWSPPATLRGIITSYTITYFITSSAENTSSTLVVTNASATSREVDELMKFTEYSLYVQASTVAGIGDQSETVNVTTDEDRPSAPRNLVAVETGPTSITANWSSPANPNGILLLYNVSLEREGLGQFENIEIRRIQAVEGVDDYFTSFDNLSAFTLYRVEVSAETRIGEGPEISDFVNTDPDSASPPTDVTVEVLNSTRIQVSWGYPEIPRGNITGYMIFTNTTENGQVNITLETLNDMSDQTHVFSGLRPFTYYEFEVAAFAETPEQTHFGRPSEPIVIQTAEDIPTQPIGFTLESVPNEPHQLLAQWNQPDPPNGVITGYTVTCTRSTNQYYPEQETTEPSEVVVPTGGDDTQATVAGLQPFTNYDCSVSANTSVGEGPPSSVLIERTVEAAPSAPRNLTILSSGPTTLGVAWRRPIPANGNITGYKLYCSGSGVQYYTDQVDPASYNMTLDGDTNSTTLMDLLPFTNYTCSISASTGAGEGVRSDEVSATTDETTPSGMPRNFAAVADTSTSVQLSWERPATPNGIIDNYTLEYYVTSDGPNSNPVMDVLGSRMTSHEVTGLNEFTEYTFRLAAVTTGPGPQATFTVTTLEDVPSAGVEDLVGVNTSSTSLQISWNPPPPADRNGIIRAYNISYGLSSENSSAYTDTSTSQTMIEFKSLEKFQFYTVLVRPYTIGSGPVESVEVQTDSDLPSEPVSLRYENVTASSIRLFWDPPLQPNGVILDYRVMYIEAVTDITVTMSGIDPMSRTSGLLIDPLMEYHYYDVRVAARTDKGFGNYSQPLTVLTNEHEPDAPENFTVIVIDSRSVRATWDNPIDPNGIILSFSLALQLAPGQDYLPPPTETAITLDPSTFERVIQGLHPFARYDFTLRAATSFGEGNITNSFAITNEAAPSEGVRNVTVPLISPREIRLLWTPPLLQNWNGILTNYSIRVVAVTNCSEPVEMEGIPRSPRTELITNFANDRNPTVVYMMRSGEVEDEEERVGGLEEFQSYQFSVKVWNKEGSGPENDTMTTCIRTMEDVPSKPPALESFTIVSNTTGELSWQPPLPLHQNGIIVDYRLSVCDNRSNDCRNISTGSSNTYYLFSDLEPFTEYTVSIAAVTEPGEGPLSPNLTNTTFEGLPTRPRDLARNDFDHSYIVLSWSPPSTPYGNIYSYRIRYQNYKQEINQDTCSVGASEEELTSRLRFNLTNLIGDSYYCVQVSAGTGAGFGAISTIVVKLPVGPPPVDVVDPSERPEVIPAPVEDPLTGDDGISDTSAKIRFFLPTEINTNGQVDRALIYVQRMPSSNMEVGTWYQSSILTEEWPQYAALSMAISSTQRRKRQEGDIEVAFTLGNSSAVCGPTDKVCNGPLNPSAEYGVRYTLFSGNQSQEFPFFPEAQFATERSPAGEESNIGAVAGGVVGGLLVLLIIIAAVAVIGYFVFNTRRKGTLELTGFTMTNKTSERPLLQHKNGSTHGNNTNKTAVFLGPSDPGIVPLGVVKNTDTASKSRSPSKKSNSRKMMLKDLSEAVRGMLDDAGYVFSDEYEKVTEVGLDHSKEASLMAENRAKNRYTNILAYDHSRVKLSYVDDDPGSDYINASYIPGYRMRRAYIATQGPLPATFDDFWRMVWEQNTHTIIMLTQLVERGRTKCHRYWPGAECIVYGEIAVEMLNEKEKEDWTVREFKLSMEKTSRTVWHYQFTSWPDHGVPDTPTAALDFVKTVRETVLMDHGPLVVHCSAGVGRTGCFIALDTLLQHIEEHDYIDVFGLGSEMRQHRNHMIQTEAQYVFVHKAMVEYIDTHYTGKSPTRFGTFPSLYTNNFAEDSTQMTDYYGDFLSEETHM